MSSLKFFAFIKVLLIVGVAAIQLFFVNKFLSQRSNIIPSMSMPKDTFTF